MRSWWDQVTISWAATIGPTPGSSSSSGTSARTWVEDLAFECLGLFGGGLDAAGECAQHEDGGELVGCPRAGAAEAAAAVEQLADRQPPQLVAQPVGCGDDHAAQLHERDPALVDRAAPGEQQQPQRLLMLARARQSPALVASAERAARTASS